MEDEYRTQLREQLREKRRALHTIEMKLARNGINAPVGDIMDAEDLRKEIAGLEAKLGIVWPAPVPQPARYTSPTPSPIFEQQINERQEAERQRSIEHQFTLLKTYRFNLKHYRGQAQQMGAFAPPMVAHGINEARAGISAAKAALRNYNVVVDDLEGDE